MAKTYPIAVKPRRMVVSVGVAIVALYVIRLSQSQGGTEAIKKIQSPAPPIQESVAVQKSMAVQKTVAVPKDWQVERLAGGAVGYKLSDRDRTALKYEPVNEFGNSAVTHSHDEDPWLDGTRYPYVSDVSVTDFYQDSDHSHLYYWNGVWQGEGYNRVLDQNNQLVAERENGVDIDLSIYWDKSITDVTKPNFIVTVQNHQKEMAQLTNISAFWVDPETGKMGDRLDFPQLPPAYEVTVIRNGGYGGTEVKYLEPLGTTTFAYHVPGGQPNLPIRLAAVNQRFAEQQQEIANLRGKGWIVKEVPAPR